MSEQPTVEQIRASLAAFTTTDDVKHTAALMMQGSAEWRKRALKPKGHLVDPSRCVVLADGLHHGAMMLTVLVAERDALRERLAAVEVPNPEENSP